MIIDPVGLFPNHIPAEWGGHSALARQGSGGFALLSGNRPLHCSRDGL